VGTKNKTPKAIYIVTNAYISSPDSRGKTRLYKIGTATNVANRWEISAKDGKGRKTDCPGEYDLISAKLINPALDAEFFEKQILHVILDPFRVRSELREWEWFELTNTQLVGLKRLLASIGESIPGIDLFADGVDARVAQETLEDSDDGLEENGTVDSNRQSKVTLSQLGIAGGTRLIPVLDRCKSRFVIATPDNKVLLDGTGEPMSLSAAARAISGYKSTSGYQMFMTEDGKVLTDIKQAFLRETAENAE